MAKSRRGDASAVMGMVKFPTDQENTGEGGMFVRLIVLPPPRKKNSPSYLPCCGGYSSFQLDEIFVGDDTLPSRGKGGKPLSWSLEHARRLTALERKYFSPSQEVSVACLAVITLGATGWSNGRWSATFGDLTTEGTELVLMMQRLYPECELRLLTFLDT